MAGDKTLLTIGHGYCARALSRLLRCEPGWTVIGTTRDKKGCERIIESGVRCRIWPGGDLAGDIAAATHILISTPPGESGDPVIRKLSGALASAESIAWIGYLSTTAVYGDRSGEWVDESTDLAPTTRRGMQRAAAERAWQEFARRSGLAVRIFRLAGIYGPGRGPLAQIRSGKKQSQVIKPGQIFNRVHVDDIARILMASMTGRGPEAIYNVSDDCPAPPEEVSDYACRLLGLPPLPRVEFAAADISPMARSFYSESKRVSNRRVKRTLKLRLLYPDYKAGLRALI